MSSLLGKLGKRGKTSVPAGNCSSLKASASGGAGVGWKKVSFEEQPSAAEVAALEKKVADLTAMVTQLTQLQTAASSSAPSSSALADKKSKSKKKKAVGSSANPFEDAATSSDANSFASDGKKGVKGDENPFVRPAEQTVLSVAFKGNLQSKSSAQLQSELGRLVGQCTLTMLLKERAGKLNCKVKTFLLAVVQLLKGRDISDEVIACVIAVFTMDRDARIKEQVKKHGPTVSKQLHWLCDNDQLLPKCHSALKSSGLSETMITKAFIKAGNITNAQMVVDAYNAA